MRNTKKNRLKKRSRSCFRLFFTGFIDVRFFSFIIFLFLIGHKFAQRNGHDPHNIRDPKHDQRAPIFLQFLDAVFQVNGRDEKQRRDREEKRKKRRKGIFPPCIFCSRNEREKKNATCRDIFLTFFGEKR